MASNPGRNPEERRSSGFRKLTISACRSVIAESTTLAGVRVSEAVYASEFGLISRVPNQLHFTVNRVRIFLSAVIQKAAVRSDRASACPSTRPSYVVLVVAHFSIPREIIGGA